MITSPQMPPYDAICHVLGGPFDGAVTAAKNLYTITCEGAFLIQAATELHYHTYLPQYDTGDDRWQLVYIGITKADPV